MANVLDSQRLHRLRQQELEFGEDQRFGRCDGTSYSYFVLSMALFSVGTAITVLALGQPDGFMFKSLGHMWLVGPIFICSGMMVAVKSMLYLRRKSVLQMLRTQRAIIRDMATEQGFSSDQVVRTASSATLPPSYEALITSTASGSGAPSAELPPPSYDEAMYLIGDEKHRNIIENIMSDADSKDSSEQSIQINANKP